MSAADHNKAIKHTQGAPADPCSIVIFGATGDLTKRKLIPALYNLAVSKLLPEAFNIIGFAFDQMNTDQFRDYAGKEMRGFADNINEEALSRIEQHLHYLQGDFRDPAACQRLRETLEALDPEHKTRGNVVYYLATAPGFFGGIVDQLGAAGLTGEEGGQWRRVVIEKPFGHDLESALALNAEIKKTLDEHQIYRIDHYLGKETVQNIMVFRFGNGIFEPIWDRRYIEHVQITALEDIGVEKRGSYYDKSGALRDMVPNHIFQLLSLVAMEPPISFEADAVRDEQAKLIHAIQPLVPEEVLSRSVRGQYGPGKIRGEPVVGYRQEEQVDPESRTETFVALKLLIDNWRWADVPFFIRTGKRIAQHVTEIAIQFKRAPFLLFRSTPIDRLRTNRLVIRILPDEGISLRFGAKVPGPVMKLGAVEMDFDYADYFGTTPATGYERLLYDCMTGDATLFQRADMVEAGWSVIAPILDVWNALPPRAFPNYAAGSWGPEEADELLSRDGAEWRLICE
jgi:glucose-6-phosphate 1-dehydrogenase